MTVTELKRRLDAGDAIVLLDVREETERRFVQIGGMFIPLGEIPSRMNEIPREGKIVVYCHSGVRSERAASFLRTNGFRSAESLEGGIDAWAAIIDNSLPRY
jgi:adenylyltransferase/sulfurtransferase